MSLLNIIIKRKQQTDLSKEKRSRLEDKVPVVKLIGKRRHVCGQEAGTTLHRHVRLTQCRIQGRLVNERRSQSERFEIMSTIQHRGSLVD